MDKNDKKQEEGGAKVIVDEKGQEQKKPEKSQHDKEADKIGNFDA